MKKYSMIFSMLINLILLASCHKEAPDAEQATTLTVVNTVVQGEPVHLSNSAKLINNNATGNIGLMPGEANLYVYPVSDSIHPYYTNPKLTVGAGEVFTLFLGGSPVATDAIFLKEAFPRHADSTMSVRFVNLSPGSPAVNLTLSTTPTVAEFSEVPYKQATEFKTYPVKSTNNSYTFQVRKAIDKTLITSITFSGTNLTTGLPRFKNVTIVLRGLVGASPAAGITRVNHY